MIFTSIFFMLFLSLCSPLPLVFLCVFCPLCAVSSPQCHPTHSQWWHPGAAAMLRGAWRATAHPLQQASTALTALTGALASKCQPHPPHTHTRTHTHTHTHTRTHTHTHTHNSKSNPQS